MIHPKDLHLVDETAVETILREDGAADVKIEAVTVHQTRIRSEAIVDARETWDKICAFWDSKEIVIPDDAKTRLKEKLTSVEQRTQAAPGLFPE